jgi:glycosyltransferase involved in cell wall biosynthesis
MLILPVFNEASRESDYFWKELVSYSDIDFVFVDDCSTDNSLELLERYRNHPNVGLLRLRKNQGKAEAIRQTFVSEAKERSNIKYVGYLDSDGAFPAIEAVRHIPKAIEKFKEGYSLYTVSRVTLSGRDIKRKTYRHLIGRLIRTFIALRHKSLPYDTQSGFKLFKNDSLLDQVMSVPFATKWFVDIEVINRRRVLSNDLGLIWEEPALTWSDIGNSSIKFRSSFRILVDIIRILRMGK